MAIYQFRYTNAAGSVIRSTMMQCESDEEAIKRASETMRDRYFALEVFEGERRVHSITAARLQPASVLSGAL